MSISVRVLILSNLIPLIGATFFGWDIFALLFSYWLETIIIGAYNVPKLIRVCSRDNLPQIKINGQDVGLRLRLPIYIGFYVIHFFSFILATGVFLFKFFWPSNVDLIFVLLTAVSTIISHGFSFKTNFLDRKEYVGVSPNYQMYQPYRRVLVILVVVILGGFIIGFQENKTPALVFLVIIKTFIDLWSHTNEHSLNRAIEHSMFGRPLELR